MNSVCVKVRCLNLSISFLKITMAVSIKPLLGLVATDQMPGTVLAPVFRVRCDLD